MLAVDQLEATTFTKIFSTIVDWHFAKGYGDKIVTLGKVIILVIGRTCIFSEGIFDYYLLDLENMRFVVDKMPKCQKTPFFYDFFKKTDVMARRFD